MTKKNVASGVVRRMGKPYGFLRDPSKNFKTANNDVFITPDKMREYRIVEGAFVVGTYTHGDRSMELDEVESINGLSPEDYMNRKYFRDLTPVAPDKRFNLGITGDPTTRAIDLIAPIGKGTRGLIVSPPKAGKTTVLMEIAKAIKIDDPNARIIVVLVDERPEEVTHFRRSTGVEVFASSNDEPLGQHIQLSEITLAMARVELECGKDVVLLVDSLTRMGRAFNLNTNSTGRTLSGGIEAGALEIPRRFFGLARNVENGGSLTIIASALVDTGSRMDEFIFQEFKGTGNSEIVLDRSLAEKRIFPAINIEASGTRREEYLYGTDEHKRVTKLRRALIDQNNEDAINTLLGLFKKYPTNEELLNAIPV